MLSSRLLLLLRLGGPSLQHHTSSHVKSSTNLNEASKPNSHRRHDHTARNGHRHKPGKHTGSSKARNNKHKNDYQWQFCLPDSRPSFDKSDTSISAFRLQPDPRTAPVQQEGRFTHAACAACKEGDPLTVPNALSKLTLSVATYTKHILQVTLQNIFLNKLDLLVP